MSFDTAFQTQLLERLVRMETKIDHINIVTDNHAARLKDLEDTNPNPDHEARIRKLERAIWLAVGAAGAGGGALGSILGNLNL